MYLSFSGVLLSLSVILALTPHHAGWFRGATAVEAAKAKTKARTKSSAKPDAAKRMSATANGAERNQMKSVGTDEAIWLTGVPGEPNELKRGSVVDIFSAMLRDTEAFRTYLKKGHFTLYDFRLRRARVEQREVALQEHLREQEANKEEEGHQKQNEAFAELWAALRPNTVCPSVATIWHWQKETQADILSQLEGVLDVFHFERLPPPPTTADTEADDLLGPLIHAFVILGAYEHLLATAEDPAAVLAQQDAIKGHLISIWELVLSVHVNAVLCRTNESLHVEALTELLVTPLKEAGYPLPPFKFNLHTLKMEMAPEDKASLTPVQHDVMMLIGLMLVDTKSLIYIEEVEVWNNMWLMYWQRYTPLAAHLLGFTTWMVDDVKAGVLSITFEPVIRRGRGAAENDAAAGALYSRQVRASLTLLQDPDIQAACRADELSAIDIDRCYDDLTFNKSEDPQKQSHHDLLLKRPRGMYLQLESAAQHIRRRQYWYGLTSLQHDIPPFIFQSFWRKANDLFGRRVLPAWDPDSSTLTAAAMMAFEWALRFETQLSPKEPLWSMWSRLRAKKEAIAASIMAGEHTPSLLNVLQEGLAHFDQFYNLLEIQELRAQLGDAYREVPDDALLRHLIMEDLLAEHDDTRANDAPIDAKRKADAKKAKKEVQRAKKQAAMTATLAKTEKTASETDSRSNGEAKENLIKKEGEEATVLEKGPATLFDEFLASTDHVPSSEDEVEKKEETEAMPLCKEKTHASVDAAAEERASMSANKESVRKAAADDAKKKQWAQNMADFHDYVDTRARAELQREAEEKLEDAQFSYAMLGVISPPMRRNQRRRWSVSLPPDESSSSELTFEDEEDDDEDYPVMLSTTQP